MNWLIHIFSMNYYCNCEYPVSTEYSRCPESISENRLDRTAHLDSPALVNAYAMTDAILHRRDIPALNGKSSSRICRPRTIVHDIQSFLGRGLLPNATHERIRADIYSVHLKKPALSGSAPRRCDPDALCTHYPNAANQLTRLP